MTKYYSIGEVSKALDLSVQAIRLYQKKKLIEPTYVNEETGYRYFNDEQIGKLWRIKVLQSAGFELKEILEMDEKSLEDIEGILMEKKEDLEKVILQKTFAKNYLDRQLSAIRAWQLEAVIELKWFDDRYGIAFAKEPRDTFMAHMKDLVGIEGRLELNQEVTYFPSRRMKWNGKRMILSDLFAMDNKKGEGLTVQEGGWYLCHYIKGRDEYQTVYKKLFDYAKENGFTIRGDAIELILISSNLVSHSGYNIRQVQLAVLKD